MMKSNQVGRQLLNTCCRVARTKLPTPYTCVRSMSIMSKIPFLGKGKEEGQSFIVTDRSEEWYEQELPSPERLETVLRPLAEEYLDLEGCTTWQEATFPTLAAKFSFLSSAIEELQRDIPSSQLAYLVTAGDVEKYFQTPVEHPKYIELRPQSLPLNVKIVMDSIKKPIDQS